MDAAEIFERLQCCQSELEKMRSIAKLLLSHDFVPEQAAALKNSLALLAEEVGDHAASLYELLQDPCTESGPQARIAESVDFIAAHLAETLANSKAPKSGLITVESRDGKPLAACFFARPAGNVLEQVADTFSISKTVIISGGDL